MSTSNVPPAGVGRGGTVPPCPRDARTLAPATRRGVDSTTPPETAAGIGSVVPSPPAPSSVLILFAAGSSPPPSADAIRSATMSFSKEDPPPPIPVPPPLLSMPSDVNRFAREWAAVCFLTSLAGDGNGPLMLVSVFTTSLDFMILIKEDFSLEMNDAAAWMILVRGCVGGWGGEREAREKDGQGGRRRRHRPTAEPTTKPARAETEQ